MKRSGAQIQSIQTYTFGRFETMVKPGTGSGAMAGSFFSFYSGDDFRTNWEEIDFFEFMGMLANRVDLNVIHTVNGRKVHGSVGVILDKVSADNWWKICVDWYPDKVVWKINDKVVRTLSVKLKLPHKIMLNIWQGKPNWAGELNEGILPQYAKYEYVQYSAYENGKFVFKWKDSFNTLDLKRWRVADWPIEDLTVFVKENVYIEDNKLVLKLT